MKNKKPSPDRVYEYKMTPEYASFVLSLRKKEQSKLEPQAYLCEWVNSQCGLMGTCVKVQY